MTDDEAITYYCEKHGLIIIPAARRDFAIPCPVCEGEATRHK